MGCSDIHGISTDDIDQSGFNPEFTCSADYGFKCNQKAPCHPCPLIRARLWCSCDQVRQPILVTTPALTTTPIPNPIQCHDFHDKIWSAVTCSDACWRVSYFDFKLGNVRNDYGCMDQTYCDGVYQREQCYRWGSIDSSTSSFSLWSLSLEHSELESAVHDPLLKTRRFGFRSSMYTMLQIKFL